MALARHIARLAYAFGNVVQMDVDRMALQDLKRRVGVLRVRRWPAEARGREYLGNHGSEALRHAAHSNKHSTYFGFCVRISAVVSGAPPPASMKGRNILRYWPGVRPVERLKSRRRKARFS